MIKVSLESVHFGHLGNGITVWTTEIEKNNDYLKLAHIDKDRNITWREQCIFSVRHKVEKYAKTANPTVSVTQTDEYVFNTKV